MKKTILLFVLVILLVGTVSAFEFDNVKSYDEKTKTVKIKNAFGLGEAILNSTLETPQEYHRGIGYLQVAQFDIKPKQDYEDVINWIKTYDLNDNGKEIERQIDVKYLTYETEVVDDYRDICTKGIVFCDKQYFGKKEITREVWLDFNNSIKSNKKVTIGLFTDVKQGDRIEWIPKIAGVEVDEWAVWVGDFATDIVSAWLFEEEAENGDAIIDDFGRHNGINYHATSSSDGVIGNTYYWDGVDNVMNISDSDSLDMGTATFGIAFQVLITDVGQVNDMGFISKEEAGVDGWMVYFQTSDDSIVFFTYGLDDTSLASGPIRQGVWYDVIFNYDGSDKYIYINNTQNKTEAATGTLSANTRDLWLGRYHSGDTNFQEMELDTLILKNSTFTPTERNYYFNRTAYAPKLVDPVVTLYSPKNGSTTTNQTVTFIGTAIGYDPLVNVSLYIDGLLNQTNSTGIVNNTNYTFTQIVSFDRHNYTYVACNSIGCATATTRIFNVDVFIENAFFFNSTAFETDTETFTINITTLSDITSISAFLNYNGTRYVSIDDCRSDTCNISSTIDLPLNIGGSKFINKSFFWQITFLGVTTTTANTTALEQNVSSVSFGACGTTPAVNFTIHNETDQTALKDVDFQGKFTYYLGSGSVTKINNTVSSGIFFQDMCIDEHEDFTVNSEIDLSKSLFSDRKFDFVKDVFNNVTETVRLSLLNSSAATNVILEVKDFRLVPLEGILVNISRYYPNENAFITIESQITDLNGQFVAKLIQNDVKYKFQFFDGDLNLLKTSEIVSVACRTSICFLPFVIEDTTNYFDRFTNVTSYFSTLTFSNSTNMFTYSWDDQTGGSTKTRLEVIRYLLNGTSMVCNITSTSSLSNLNCDVGSTRASYQAQAFRKVNFIETRMAAINAKVGDLVGTYGVEGLLWVFILLFTGIGIGAFNPSVGAVLYGVGFVIFGVLGIISMPIPVFFANTLLVVLFVWAVKT